MMSWFGNMATSKKRKRSKQRSGPAKRSKIDLKNHEIPNGQSEFHHPVLSCYYETCKTLRQHFGIHTTTSCHGPDVDRSFDQFLDGTIVAGTGSQERLDQYKSESKTFANLARKCLPESLIDHKRFDTWSMKEASLTMFDA
jgi:hypothetical protein